MYIILNFLTAAFLLVPLFSITFAQNNYYGKKIKSDNLNNTYVAGSFKSNVLKFGSYALKNSGGSDIFLAKYNPQGKIAWVKNIGGSGDEEILSMDIDNNGNISLLASAKSREINIDWSQLKNDKSEIIFNAEFNSHGKLNLSKVVKEIHQTENHFYKKSGNDTSITIISPASNDNFKVGTKARIKWYSQNVEYLHIEFSNDNGSTWQVISENTTDFNEYLFVVPNSPSDSCLVRISDYNNSGIADTSGLFKISGILYWEVKQNDYNSVFTNVFNLDSQTCIAAGYNGLSKTTDNGETWTSALSGTGLFDVFFLNDSLGWTVGFSGNIFKTTNGGADWIRQDNSFNFHLLKVFFFDKDNGYMISDRYLLKTTNGGESWILTQPTDHVLRTMFFLNKDTGWVAGGEGVILKTTDAGLTWEYQQMNGTEYATLNSLYFIDENIGWTAGSGLDIDGGVVLKTYNAGNQWSLLHNGYNRFIYSIFFITPDSGWAVGDEGTIFTTTNGGVNWELQGSGTLSNLHSITMNSKRDGWTVGDDGVILRFNNNNTSIPVPVELSAFKANSKNNTVELSWITVTETNNKGFEIERKISGEWELVGFVIGNGTTTIPYNYFFSDDLKYLTFKGNISYRLRQIDYDGSYKFSNEVIISINTVPLEYSLSQNYPNPFNPTTNIGFWISDLEFVSLKIYNVLGEEIVTLINEEKQPGFYEIEFNASTLSSGTYLYRLEAGNFVQTRKMLLVK